MASESRYGRTVRERTKLVAALMRTPDDELPAFIQEHDLAESVDVAALRRARELLDAVGIGIRGDAAAPFWQQLDAACTVLRGGQPAAPPAAIRPAAAQAPIVQPRAAQPAAQPPTVQPPTVQPAARPPVVQPAVQPPAIQPAVQPPAIQPTTQPPTAQSAAPVSLSDASAEHVRAEFEALDFTLIDETGDVPVLPQEPVLDGDFRHNLMYKPAPPASDEHTNAPVQANWRPHTDKVALPDPQQEQTIAVHALNISDVSLAAAQDALDWPVKRIAHLNRALETWRDQGRPDPNEICRFFRLPNQEAVRLTRIMWQDRLNKDADLAAEYAAIMTQLRASAEPKQ